MTLRRVIQAFSIALLALSSGRAFAFPEMIRHKYVNCTSCHLSPTGGGILTPYGRVLSGQLLSAYAAEERTGFAFGLVTPPEWLLLGGDVRAVQTYRDTPRVREGKFIWMQGDLEAAVNWKTFWFDATIGLNSDDVLAPKGNISDRVISRRHWVNWRPTDQVSFRAGRFWPAFGIGFPDHYISVRRGLRIKDEGMESYNLEAAWIGDRASIFATGVLGRPEQESLQIDKGGTLVGTLALGDSHKLGMSYLYGSSDVAKRHVFGPYAILGFTPRFFLLSELDFQRSQAPTSTAKTQWGLANYQRLDYEFVQGLHGYLTQQLSRLDFSSVATLGKSYGVGLQIFPYPHFELNASWEFQTSGNTSGYADFSWLLLHYYF